jgi:hypothetical protein
MFVRYFVELSLPFPEVEEGLLRVPWSGCQGSHVRLAMPEVGFSR